MKLTRLPFPGGRTQYATDDGYRVLPSGVRGMRWAVYEPSALDGGGFVNPLGYVINLAEARETIAADRAGRR
ncbi:hypothetical protein [Microbispora sp. NPDC049125]|uniref:hypothetical protein n=1 Tax=Microbispora sp. NPDC049125 TaxID=3154929 RepID=UPI00346644A4